MNINFKKRTVFISGCTSGIGKATLYKLHSLGANCIGLSRNISILKKLQIELSEQRFQYIYCDLKNPAQLSRKLIKSSIKSEWLPVSIVINNVGGSKVNSVEAFSENIAIDEINKHYISFNLINYFFLDNLKDSGNGRIINVLGTSVIKPFTFLPYNAAKAAMWNYSKIQAKEFKKYNITVNNIFPGPTKTKELSHIVHDLEVKKGFKDFGKTITQMMPSGALLEPEDIVNGILFLASNYAGSINGIDLIIDDGYSL